MSICQGSIVLNKCIGKGQFGSVYLGINQLTKETVAVKVMEKSAILKIPILKDLFPNEIKLLKSLQSTNIVRYIADDETPQQYFLAMEYCDEGELFKKLQKAKRFDERTALEYFCQILNGIQEMHKKGIIHRDIKLENIMIKQGMLKIVDFGFSKQLDAQNLQDEITKTILGTPIYMGKNLQFFFIIVAPEILLGKPYKVLQSEMFSLGILLYFMIAGRPPFLFPNRFNQDDIELAQVIEKGNIQFEFKGTKDLIQKKKKIDFTISQETKCLLKRMLAYSNRISFQELYQTPLISGIMSVDKFRGDGSGGIGPEFNPVKSVIFYSDYETKINLGQQSQKQLLNVTSGPQDQEEQKQFLNVTFSYLSPTEIKKNPQEEQESQKLLDLLQQSKERQQKINEAIIKFKLCYEQQLNHIILLTNNLLILQQWKVGYVKNRQIGQAFILAKVYFMAFRLKNALENNLNIFNLPNFELIKQNILYQIFKQQILDHYYPSIEISFLIQIDEYLQYMEKNQLDSFELYVEYLKKKKPLDEKLFEENYNENIIIYFKQLKKFQDDEFEWIKSIKDHQQKAIQTQKTQNIYKIILAVLYSIKVEEQFSKQDNKPFDFGQFNQKFNELFSGKKNLQQEFEMIQDLYQKYLN